MRATLFTNTEYIDVERKRRKISAGTGALLRCRLDIRRYVLACDRWQMLEHNIYALHLALRNFRNLEAWGLGSLPQVMGGFVEHAADGSGGVAASFPRLEDWQEELGLGPTATLDDATAVYHRRAKSVAHEEERLIRLNLMMEKAREYFKQQCSASFPS